MFNRPLLVAFKILLTLWGPSLRASEVPSLPWLCADSIVGDSEAVKRLREQIKMVAGYGTTVLILGETGSGKTLAARAIHDLSGRREQRFVAVNCSNINPNLLESELFGHLKGSFTGATSDRKGLFELAKGGTIFLDEIGELPLELQARILTAVEEKQFYPVGGSQAIQVDVRIISATHVDLNKAIKEGKFRADLYYRLGTLKMMVPSLRDRIEDIEILAKKILIDLGTEHNLTPKPLSQSVLELFRIYFWGGNIRELKSTLTHALFYSDYDKKSSEILVEHLPSEFLMSINPVQLPPDWFNREPLPTLKDLELIYLQHLMDIFGNNRRKVASVLGVSPKTVFNKLKSIEKNPG